MKPKVYVAIALMLSILVAGLILILGLSKSTLLPIYLIIFFAIIIVLFIFSARESLQDNAVTIGIVLMLIALSATLYLTNLKTYYDIVNTYSNPDSAPEIKLLQSQNDYYYAYANYLNQSILVYQDRIKQLEAQLSELQKLELANQLATANQQTNIASASTQVQTAVTNPTETSYISSAVQEQNEGQDE